MQRNTRDEDRVAHSDLAVPRFEPEAAHVRRDRDPYGTSEVDLTILACDFRPLVIERDTGIGDRPSFVVENANNALLPGRPDDLTVAPVADLANAFVRQEMQLVYQPKIWMRSGKFAGVESLVRWKHPALGMIQPNSFVPMIEGSEEMSASLTDYSLRESIACVGRWREAGRELRVAINLSARTFDRLDLPERVNAMCLEHQVEPECITLELTETYVASDAIRIIDVATRLRLKGFNLSIDDFGTGQSGLAKLQKLPFNELKIDRQFVNGCAQSGTQRSVVEASLALARSLKMTSVAEGIQNRRTGICSPSSAAMSCRGISSRGP